MKELPAWIILHKACANARKGMAYPPDIIEQMAPWKIGLIARVRGWTEIAECPHAIGQE